MSVTQSEKAARFLALHQGPSAFVIPNPWDVASARILAGFGFQALATSSAASAAALGRKDHELTREESLAQAHLIQCDRFARFGGSGKGVWRRAGSRGRNHPTGGRHGTRWVHDRGFYGQPR